MSSISIPPPLLPEKLPPVMVATDRWLPWQYQVRKPGSKPTKVPLSSAGVPADATSHRTWNSLAKANALSGFPYDGRGWAFADTDDFGGFDVDNCLTDTGAIQPWAPPILDLFLDAAGNSVTYCEISPSGFGIKFFGRFSVPVGRKIEFEIEGEKCGVEAYSQKRFFTVTTDHWRNPPLDLAPIQTAVDRALEIAAELSRRYPLSATGRGSANGAAGTYPPPGHLILDVNIWLSEHNLSARGPIAYNSGWKWVLGCPFDPSHIVAVIIQTPPHYRPAFHCPHNSCAAQNWDTLNRKFDPDYQRPTSGSTPTPIKLDALSPGELYDLQVATPEPLIDQIAPRAGCTMLTAAAKTGKTVFACEFAIAVARGQPLLDSYKVRRQGGVLIVEADDPTGHGGISDILRAANVQRDEAIYTIPKDPSLILCPEFVAALERRIVEQKLALVVLDSYTALRPARKGGTDIVKEDAAEMTRLDLLGKRTDCLILLLHHDSHGGATRHWTTRSGGTYGLQVAIESQIYLCRYDQLPIEARERWVRLEGRHLDTLQLTLKFNPQKLAFDFLMDGVAAGAYPFILQLWEEWGSTGAARSKFTPKDIYDLTSLGRNKIHENLRLLRRGGVLIKTAHGEYKFADSWCLHL